MRLTAQSQAWGLRGPGEGGPAQLALLSKQAWACHTHQLTPVMRVECRQVCPLKPFLQNWHCSGVLRTPAGAEVWQGGESLCPPHPRELGPTMGFLVVAETPTVPMQGAWVDFLGGELDPSCSN